MSGATRPAFLVVDDDIEIAAALEGALNRRFGADYKIIAESSPEHGLAVLARLRDREEQVAAVIADEWMPRMTGVDFLLKAHQLHPAARRALLFDAFADRGSQKPLLRALALCRVDTWLVKPWEPADHHLYGTATGLPSAGSFTMMAAITQLLPYPVFAGAGAEPSWNHDTAHTFLPHRRNKVSSIATMTGSSAGTSISPPPPPPAARAPQRRRASGRST